MESSILRWIVDEHALAELVADIPTAWLVVLIAVCILVLSKGAERMIEGAVRLARRTGLQKIVIGATIISLGTTTPEAFVSVMAAWLGNPGLALGNGVGSIICDTGLIFGLTCLLARVPVNRYILNRTGWVQVGAATLLVILSVISLARAPEQPTLHRWVGLFLLVLLSAYMYITYAWARNSSVAAYGDDTPDEESIGSIGKGLAQCLGGLALVVVAARVLIPSAAELAHRMGVPDDVIAATMVAFGTSLPELMTAVAAVRKGHPEITVGNIVGADVLNCLFVIGASAAARPLEIPPNFFLFHFPAMLIILYSFRVFITMNKDGTFKRWQGAWLLCIYLVYLLLQYGFNIGGSPV
jgi:cation:H+ antiporter